MRREAGRIIITLSLALMCQGKADGQENLDEGGANCTHCVFYPENQYLNPYRLSILKAAGFLKDNTDGTQSYVRSKLVFEKPVSCFFTVNNFGTLIKLSIYKTSGYKTIDAAALALVRKAAPFKPDPKSNGQLVYFGKDGTDVRVEDADRDWRKRY